ncbi:MAG: hypothetical protein Q7T33_06930 [Dehalococcoidia bacterium]|nr:hypothetical protein [Dehalococcoidia bacterium]
MKRASVLLAALLLLMLAAHARGSAGPSLAGSDRGGEETSVAAGDADCDGTIGARDTLAVLRFQTGAGALPCPAAADLNCDGLVDFRDALEPLRYRAGLPPSHAVPGCRPAGATGDIEFVAHVSPGPGAYGDVWSLGDYAFIGRWRNPCDGRGPAIIDISDPAHPRFLRDLPVQPNTTAEDVVALDVATPFFSGALLATGLQDCQRPGLAPGQAGLQLFDVTDPQDPVTLGFFSVAPNEGVHELSVFARGGQAFALLAVPESEVFDPQHQGDLRIIDITDPRHPVQVAAWGIGAQGGLAFGSPLFRNFGLGPPYDCTPPPGTPAYCRGAAPRVFLHSVSTDGEFAYLSWWDAGFITLDISNPAHPVFVNHGETPPGDDGDTHSALRVPGRPLVLTTDEDFSPQNAQAPGDTWGRLRIWDISDPANPQQAGEFATPRSLTNRRDGVFSVHNPEVAPDGSVYLSWYSDGVRVLDLSDPASPRETASYVPPAADVWGVRAHNGLILASDIQTGLWILRPGAR